MKILVTAGPTCEDIDPVRYITNRSTGKMGFAIAAAALERGHEVTLVSGPVSLDPPAGVKLVSVRSTDQMLRACQDVYDDIKVAFLAAAVADYKPVRRVEAKIKKSEDVITIELTRTPDIAFHLGQSKGSRILVGFALESDAGRVNAERKLADKSFDAICLNGPETFGSDRIRAEILERDRPWLALPVLSKAELAGRLLDLAERRASQSG